MLAERIARPPGSVLSEVIRGELLSLAEQLAELQMGALVQVSQMGTGEPAPGRQSGVVMPPAGMGSISATISRDGDSTYQ